MAKANSKKRDLRIEEKAEAASSIPVHHDEDGPDEIEQEPVVTKQPLVYLRHPELREAWVTILAMRVMREPVPEHLSINDNLAVTNNRAVELVKRAIVEAGAELTMKTARQFADKVVPAA